MTLTTYEGIVEKGRIRLKTGIRLPENTKVYVIVPDLQVEKKKTVRVRTPRLANRKQVGDFIMRVDKA